MKDKTQEIEENMSREPKVKWLTKCIPCDWDGWLERKWKQLKAIFKRDGRE